MTVRSIHPRRRAGFTLVEMLVVVFIIGLLTAILVSIIPKVKRGVYGAQTQAQMVAIATACQAYYNDFRAYPGPIPNAMVGSSFYQYSAAPQNTGVYILDSTGTAQPLQLATGVLGGETYGTFTQRQFVTGAENLVLGLLGGLELKLPTGGATALTFAYSDASIYPDGKTPGPLGPLVLNQSTPKRFGAYLQVKAGDLSNSRTLTAAPDIFHDEGGRMATDSPIPEFLDKFSNQMPILYVRANVGGTAILGVGGQSGFQTGTLLQDSNGRTVVPQYDLAGVVGYTRAPSMGVAIGINPSDTAHNHHGLQDLGTMTDSVVSGYANAGANGLAYFKDPNNPGTSNTPNYGTSPPGIGNARQKDAYVLISAGPDGIYGTADDIIYPGGSVNP